MKNTILVLVAMWGLSACTVVGPGERAVRYNFGAVSDNVMEPGTHLWVPYFLGSQTLDVQIHAIQTTTNAGTKDQQEVNTTVTVNAQIDPVEVVNVVKTVGGDSQLVARVQPLIQEAVNAVISKYSAEEILTKRSQVKMDIEALVKERIQKYHVIVHDISLQDMQYSKGYSEAIERKQIAEQAAKQAEYETEKVKQEAKAAVAKAQGEADSNKLKQQTLTDALIRYEMIQKWDGHLPTVMVVLVA